MVATRLPERIETSHPVPADQDILNGEGQRVAHVKAAGHVGWRHHDDVGGSLALGITGEEPAFLPALILLRFDLCRSIGLFKLCHGRRLPSVFGGPKKRQNSFPGAPAGKRTAMAASHDMGRLPACSARRRTSSRTIRSTSGGRFSSSHALSRGVRACRTSASRVWLPLPAVGAAPARAASPSCTACDKAA